MLQETRDNENRIVYFKKDKKLPTYPISVRDFLSVYTKDLQVAHINFPIGADRKIYNERIYRPGLALADYYGRLAADRIQLIGETEYSYMESVSSEELTEKIEGLFSYEMTEAEKEKSPGSDGKINVIVFSKSIPPPKEILDIAQKYNVAVMVSRLVTEDFARKANQFLERHFAPKINLHATLVDIYGVGVLLVGESGVGKSECALDLIERGHRLVCDDIVYISKLKDDILMGHGGGMLGFHMEVRGAGIIDVEKMFGLKSIRLQKRVEIVVKLDMIRDKKHFASKQYVRVGGEVDSWQSDILGVKIPYVEIPIIPGKNITAIAEVLAMSVMVSAYKENDVMKFRKSIMDEINKRKNTRSYLLSDTE